MVRGAGGIRRCDVSDASEHGRHHEHSEPREAAPRCEWRCPGAPDDEEERTGDRSEHGGASGISYSHILYRILDSDTRLSSGVTQGWGSGNWWGIVDQDFLTYLLSQLNNRTREEPILL